MSKHDPHDLTTFSLTDLEADLVWGILKETEQTAERHRSNPEFAWLLKYLPGILDKVMRAP
tara:strand:+ start:5299 stop:5481 length:183 start_codon:yes stop_codon:yes gene_type:complete